MTADEFAASIKAKYPDYAQMDNTELAQKFVDKFPVYKSQVDFTPHASSFLERNAQTISDIARPVLQVGGALGGAALAGGAAAPTVAGILPGATVGGGLGFAAGSSAADALDRSLGLKKPIASPVEAAKETAGNVYGGAQAEALGLGMSKAIGATMSAVPGAAKYIATNLAGIPKATYRFAEENLPAVTKMVGKGVDVANELADSLTGKVADYLKSIKPNPSNADALAQTFTSGLKKASDTLKAEYPAQLNAIAQNPKYAVKTVKNTVTGQIENQGKTFNLWTRLRDNVFQITREFQYDNPNTLGDSSDAATFNRFAEKISNLKKATAEDVVGYLQSVNQLADKYIGTPLGAAFGKLAEAVRTTAGKSIPEIAIANSSYQAGKELEGLSSKAMGANDVIQYIRTIYDNPLSTKTKQALEQAIGAAKGLAPEVSAAIKGIRDHISQSDAADVAEQKLSKLLNTNDPIAFIKRVYSPEGTTRDKKILQELITKQPEIGDIINNILAYVHGKEFTPLMRDLPQTGMGAAIAKGIGGGALLGTGALSVRHPLVAAASAGAGAGIGAITSPRMALQALRFSQNIAPGIARRVASQGNIVRPGASAAIAALQRLRNNK